MKFKQIVNSPFFYIPLVIIITISLVLLNYTTNAQHGIVDGKVIREESILFPTGGCMTNKLYIIKVKGQPKRLDGTSRSYTVVSEHGVSESYYNNINVGDKY